MSNMVNIIWEYQQPKDGKRLAESWQKVDQKVGRKLAQNVGPTSPKGWPNVAPMLAKGWPNVAQRLGRHWANVRPTSATLARRTK